MAGGNAEQSAGMENEGRRVRERRLRLGMTIDDLASEADVSPDTLGDFEAGNRTPRELTVSKVLSALDRIEEEVGLHAPPQPAQPSPLGEGFIEFDVSGDFGVHIIVKGPVTDADILQRQVIGIIREIRAEQGKGDTPESGG